MFVAFWLAAALSILVGLVNCATVKRTFVLEPSYANPDGQYRMTFTINGQTPGPLLEGKEGDDFEIEVVNHLPVDMGIHWHGIFQKGTPHMDGVPGINMWAVPPNGNYTYKFFPKGQYGLHWYHAHFRGYLDDGVRGYIYIHPSPDRERPFKKIAEDDADEKALLDAEKRPHSLALYDWRHVQEDEAISLFEITGRPTTCVDSVLINGKGRVICPTSPFLNRAANARYDSLPYFESHLDERGCLMIPSKGPQFKTSEIASPLGCRNTTAPVDIINVGGQPWTYLNVANIGGEWSWALSIDSHDLYVVAVDGVYIEPQRVQTIEVAIGQRYGVMVRTNQTEQHDYYIRAAGEGFAQVIAGVALLRYGSTVKPQDLGAREIGDSLAYGIVADPLEPAFKDPWADLSRSSLMYNSTRINNATSFDESAAKPLFDAPPKRSTKTLIFHANQTDWTTFAISSRPLRAIQELKMPVLFEDGSNDPDWLYRVNIGEVVDIILQNSPDALFPAPAEPPHPVHLHGHNFWVLGKKEYELWSHKSVQEAIDDGVKLNLDSPVVRDSVLLPTAGWLVIRYIADNPGAWLLHCHISSHFQAGMGVVLFEGADQLPEIPDKYKTTYHLGEGV